MTYVTRKLGKICRCPPSRLVAKCLVAGDPNGKIVGALNFDVKLAKGAAAIDPKGGMLYIYAVEVVRDSLTGDVLPGLNGEPFQIEARGAVALQGVLQ